MKFYGFTYIFKNEPEVCRKFTVISTTKSKAKKEFYRLIGKVAKIKILDIKTLQ